MMTNAENFLARVQHARADGLPALRPLFDELRSAFEAAGLAGPPTADERQQLGRLLERTGILEPIQRDTVVDRARRQTMHRLEMHLPFWMLWGSLAEMFQGPGTYLQSIAEKYGSSPDGLAVNQFRLVVQLWVATDGMSPATRRLASFADCSLPMPACSPECGCELGRRAC